MKDFLNTRFIYYKGGFIIWRKDIAEDSIVVHIKLIYLIGIGTTIKSDDKYNLTDKVTLKSLISSYKEIIDGYNTISKK